MRVMVTGGCGFIGQHLVERLALSLKPNCISVVDSLEAPATGFDRVKRIGAEIHKVSILDLREVDRRVAHEEPDVVVHCAAQSHVDKSLESPAETWRVNAVGTQNMATICANRGIPLVYCSTDEVYGDRLANELAGEVRCQGFPSDVLFGDGCARLPSADEDFPLLPSSPYSASKLAGEMALAAAGRSFGLRYAITRGSNTFGFNQYAEKLIPIACNLLSSGGKVPLHGGGRQLRQWVHVEEVAEALQSVAYALVAGRLRVGSAYNIVGPRVCSVRDLVYAIAEASGVPVRDSTIVCDDRPGQDTAYFSSGGKLRNELGFHAVRDILKPCEIRALVDYYNVNRTRVVLSAHLEVA